MECYTNTLCASAATRERKDEVPKFSLNPLDIACIQDDEYIKSVIFENNKSFKCWRYPTSTMIFIECENKPRNLYASGYIWKEVNDNVTTTEPQ